MRHESITFKTPIVLPETKDELALTGISYRREAVTKRWPEVGEFEMVLIGKHTKTNEQFQLYFCQMWDKRTIEREELRTDKPALFVGCDLPGDWYCTKELADYMSGSNVEVGEDDGEDPSYWAWVTVEGAPREG